ncbi:MAG TPA: hypothetical protein DCQ31_10865 [Bacteroidales bacterium]|nr:hypothetical protein [Bacteroidales bacterium]
MASIKTLLNKSKVLSNGEHPIIIQILVNRQKKVLHTNKTSVEAHWNANKGEPNAKHPSFNMLKQFIKQRKLTLEGKLMELEKQKSDFTLSEFLDFIEIQKVQESFFCFFDKTIAMLAANNKNGNAAAYKSTRSVFAKFLNNKDLRFSEVNFALIQKFDTYLRTKGLSTNGISFHMRTLRALYNRAVKEDVASESNYPFKKYSIKREKTIHRALTKNDIAKIKNFEINNREGLEEARDYFMFSFYLRGINFVDMAYLKVKNMNGDRIEYKRAKTGDIFSMELPDQALEIIRKYNRLTEPEAFMFPVIKHPENHFREYKQAMRLTNRRLKKFGALLELNIPLTTYVARHSWATIAKRAGISTSIISESMGHETEEVTQVYLDSFENSVLDEANKKIIELL